MATITDEFMRQMLTTTRSYCLVILKTGPRRNEPGVEKIIWEHGRRNFALRADGVLSIGLSVVHGIVKQHEGYITVESTPGKGSTFAVYFPRIEGELETDNIGDDDLPTGSERILFVDDEPPLVEMGYEVTSRTSSKQALVLMKEYPSRFDLVITDQTMPEMTGIELAREILAVRPDMPIVMCTGFSHTVDAGKAQTAGIKAFAMKPLTKREIARTVRNVLDGQH